MNIIDLIKVTRKNLNETQDQFGKRFGVSGTAISMWEDGKREAKYEVIEFCLNRQIDIQICPKCSGLGIIKAHADMDVGQKSVFN